LTSHCRWGCLIGNRWKPLKGTNTVLPSFLSPQNVAIPWHKADMCDKNKSHRTLMGEGRVPVPEIFTPMFRKSLHQCQIKINQHRTIKQPLLPQKKL
jgi:hypothetical protein